MKASVIAVSLLSAVAYALPEPVADADAHRPATYGGSKWDNKPSKHYTPPKKDEDCDEYGNPKPKKNYGGDKHGKDNYYGGKKDYFPIPFTSTYRVKATPDQVVSGPAGQEAFTGGLPGAVGYYDFGINSELDTICYYIKLYGFRGEYQSPALTATHIHQADKGKFGPPRIAFPNPREIPGKDYRVSAGCLTGPFETGVPNNATGMDQGAGFKVSQIEANPKNFNADVHSSLAVPGAVRGQLA